MSMISIGLVVDAELQPFITAGMGDSTLPQNNRTGNGYSLFKPTTPTQLTDTPTDGVSMPAQARSAYIFIKNGGIRCRTDGTNPSNSSGLYLPSGTLILVRNQRQFLEQFRFCDSVGETSEVSTMYFA